MDEVSKSALKAQMFEYLRRVESTKRPLVIKDHGEPVLVVYPYKKKRSIDEVFAQYRKKVVMSDEAVLSSEGDDWRNLI